jgi:hypothetical protein
MAILGSWLMLLVIAMVMFTGYLQYDLERKAQASSNYFFSKNVIYEIQKRLDSISNKKFDENKLDWVHAFDSVEKEVVFIKPIMEGHKKRIVEYDTEKKLDYGHYFGIAKATGAVWLAILIIILAIICFWYGFTRWYKKVQKPADEALVLDNEIKNITLKTLELDLDTSTKNKAIADELLVLDKEIKAITLKKLRLELDNFKKHRNAPFSRRT